jgi:hypothetical protein
VIFTATVGNGGGGGAGAGAGRGRATGFGVIVITSSVYVGFSLLDADHLWVFAVMLTANVSLI